MSTASVELRDFQPFYNHWEATGATIQPYDSIDQELYIKEMGLIADEQGRKYLNEDPAEIRLKCLFLSLSAPIVHVFALAFNIIKISLRILFFWHFWPAEDKDKPYSIKANLIETGKDLLRIVATPLALIGMEAAAIYGMFNPLDGRKLYGSIERAMYDSFRLAPCFQPDLQPHSVKVRGESRGF